MEGSNGWGEEQIHISRTNPPQSNMKCTYGCSLCLNWHSKMSLNGPASFYRLLIADHEACGKPFAVKATMKVMVACSVLMLKKHR